MAWTKEVAIELIRLWICVEDYLNLVGNGVETEETWVLHLALDPNFSIHKWEKDIVIMRIRVTKIKVLGKVL